MKQWINLKTSRINRFASLLHSYKLCILNWIGVAVPAAESAGVSVSDVSETNYTLRNPATPVGKVIHGCYMTVQHGWEKAGWLLQEAQYLRRLGGHKTWTSVSKNIGTLTGQLEAHMPTDSSLLCTQHPTSRSFWKSGHSCASLSGFFFFFLF